MRFLRHQEAPFSEMLTRMPRECPYALDQIIGAGDEDWFPDQR